MWEGNMWEGAGSYHVHMCGHTREGGQRGVETASDSVRRGFPEVPGTCSPRQSLTSVLLGFLSSAGEGGVPIHISAPLTLSSSSCTPHPPSPPNLIGLQLQPGTLHLLLGQHRISDIHLGGEGQVQGLGFEAQGLHYK